MDRQGFLDFNTRLSPENSGKAASYVKAIEILDAVLRHQDEIDLGGQSLYNLSDTATIESVLDLVKDEVKKMKNSQSCIFDFGAPNQTSYPLKGFCSAALSSLIKYAEYEQQVVEADEIVAQEKDPRTISKKLIAHFDLTKEGDDEVSQTKRRKGQSYFRHMILTNYGNRCALTGIDIPELLVASHIRPWRNSTPLQKLSPDNGICLSALYDKAFDEGFITFSPDDYSVLFSSALRDNEPKEYFDKHFGIIEGRKLMVPEEFKPNRDFLAYHRENIFLRF